MRQTLLQVIPALHVSRCVAYKRTPNGNVIRKRYYSHVSTLGQWTFKKVMPRQDDQLGLLKEDPRTEQALPFIMILR